MRKLLFWLFAGVMALSALGNFIGGTDTTATASVAPASVSAPVRADVPIAPGFDATMFVSASSLNMREAPSTNGRVILSLKRNTQVLAGERQGGWVLVSANGTTGWVSGDYLSGATTTQTAPAISVPTRSQPGYQVVQQESAGSCPSRRYCTQIGSCQEARFYLANCSWGGKLDSDSDGVPCESICR